MSGGTILDQAPAAPVAKPAPSPLVPLPASVEIAVLGGGAAGLACARHLARSGRDVHLFEAEPEVGGRMRTIIDRDRFHLDAGFHVLLTGYPAVRRDLDLASLRVRPFEPGAIVAARGHFHPLPDPFRNGGWLDALRFPFASMGDKMRFAGYRRRVASLSDEEIARSPDRSTREHLREIGLSDGFVDSFFVPFFGGVFLDPSLGASSRYFQSILRAFSNGDAGIPADGIGAVPRQIAAGIPPDRIHTAVRADSLIIEQERVCGFVAGERQVRAEKVVVACSPAESARLTGLAFPPLRALGVSVVYFAAPRPPTGEKRLFLRGDPEGWTNQFAVLTNVAPELAPEGQHLLAGVILGAPDLHGGALSEKVRGEMAAWFPHCGTHLWRWLRTVKIPEAQWALEPGLGQDLPEVRTTIPGLFLAGDYTREPSLAGALESGREAADAVLGG